MTAGTEQSAVGDGQLSLERQVRRANSYKLLSECFHPPTDDLHDLLTVGEETSIGVPVEKLAAAIPDDAQRLRVDHAKLFVGPFELQAPPYGSVYLDDEDRVMTDSTLEVREWYRTEGFAVNLHEPADHIAAELEFLYALAADGAAAIERDDAAAAIDSCSKQSAFLESHLGRWISPFVEEMQQHAETEFYETLATVTEEFVVEDGRYLGELTASVGDDPVESLE